MTVHEGISVRGAFTITCKIPEELKCPVRMAEIHNDAVVFTLDQDFKIYRKSVSG